MSKGVYLFMLLLLLVNFCILVDRSVMKFCLLNVICSQFVS
jgi:hypothetical protein